VAENPAAEPVDDRNAAQPCPPAPPAGQGPPAYPQPAAAARRPPGYPPSPPASVPLGSASGPSQILASAADRERAIDVCKASYGEGRLTKEEFDARVHQITASRTYGDLAVLISDLPAGPLGGVSQYPAGGYPVLAPYYPSPARPTNGMAIGSLVCALTMISLPAVIMGHVARSQIRDRNEAGDGIAIAGLVFGWLGVAAWTLFIVAIISLAHG
jgi:hypothetical protein